MKFLSNLKAFVQDLFTESPKESAAIDRAVDEMMKAFEPPEDLEDGAAWDQYWKGQLKLGIGPPFLDMMIADEELVRVMKASGLSTVLCVGNGMSMEPRALAAAGFDVTALDVGPRVTSFASRVPVDDTDIERLIGANEQVSGGQCKFVTGNLFEETVCPGPYDVVIERRTAQNYAVHKRMGEFLAAAARRLGEPGLFVSHCHDGSWRPDQEPRHLPGEWFIAQEWEIWRDSAPRPLQGRVAWLVTSTG